MTEVATHRWGDIKQGGNPAESGSYEYVRVCDVCGMEDTCEDDMPPCPGIAAPIPAATREQEPRK